MTMHQEGRTGWTVAVLLSVLYASVIAAVAFLYIAAPSIEARWKDAGVPPSMPTAVLIRARHFVILRFYVFLLPLLLLATVALAAMWLVVAMRSRAGATEKYRARPSGRKTSSSRSFQQDPRRRGELSRTTA